MELVADLWVVVLAGGEGRRVQEFTRDPRGGRVPKQFFSFNGGRSLLRRTLDRALLLTATEQVVAVVSEDQREWWRPELADFPTRNALSQPSNRGTAVAILRALAEVSRREPEAVMLVVPSDHEVGDEAALVESLR